MATSLITTSKSVAVQGRERRDPVGHGDHVAVLEPEEPLEDLTDPAIILGEEDVKLAPIAHELGPLPPTRLNCTNCTIPPSIRSARAPSQEDGEGSSVR